MAEQVAAVEEVILNAIVEAVVLETVFEVVIQETQVYPFLESDAYKTIEAIEAHQAFVTGAICPSVFDTVVFEGVFEIIAQETVEETFDEVFDEIFKQGGQKEPIAEKADGAVSINKGGAQVLV